MVVQDYTVLREQRGSRRTCPTHIRHEQGELLYVYYRAGQLVKISPASLF